VRRSGIVLSILMGLGLGIGLFTLRYAEGLSYLGSDPAACANCHIMQPQYDSWQKASHHAVATCIDCHLPHTFVRKYLAKAENGFFHSKAFTLQNFHEPIQITPKSKRILQENCVHCHAGLIHEVAAGALVSDPQAVDCTHCHQTAGHGEAVGLGGPERGHQP